MPRVGDVAVADRGVPTGAIGSHVGFVTSVDLENDTFTLESGNAGSIYTRRKISCFSFHTPPNDVRSALNGSDFPFGTLIGTVLTGLPLSRASNGLYPFVPATSWADPNDCSQRSLDADNYDALHSLDGKRVCALHLPPSDARRFCPYARMARESIMYRPYRRCTATTTKDEQCLAWRLRQPACFI
jgi:hypothetical protein